MTPTISAVHRQSFMTVFHFHDSLSIGQSAFAAFKMCRVKDMLEGGVRCTISLLKLLLNSTLKCLDASAYNLLLPTCLDIMKYENCIFSGYYLHCSSLHPFNCVHCFRDIRRLVVDHMSADSASVFGAN